MLPKDPAKHDEYRAKLREASLRQERQTGWSHSDETRARQSAAAKASPTHRSKCQDGGANAKYKGGHLDKHGYWIVRHNGKDVPEHRVVMARMIGRALRAEETVRHKNGNRTDNRPENLELWSSRNPKGQRIEDKLEYAREILRLYGMPQEAFSLSDFAGAVLTGAEPYFNCQ